MRSAESLFLSIHLLKYVNSSKSKLCMAPIQQPDSFLSQFTHHIANNDLSATYCREAPRLRWQCMWKLSRNEKALDDVRDY